ncbi:MAG: Gfo/Idh/MocA family oxidoreductase [Lentisphaerae bacterium]|jgi:predicted dehydrogenase|nr:Gfo/Idh/MocA family oxidoreductase [Lentisphaerota bacterium]MBT4818631.1 Gfo/Idh/MocA family oxidoreductase [Lentisphaerota bacterium]MBT5606894.1 Gfo/Idh/MocA family oxidoreductase [Lentisphaerota bacterium]MBT7058340.1 Gfo/Idh/MocA family oxidoreductase [Lentisphaerota bacterium]MBT7843613.1 Gfo/Idh/MocA family oxidoreductase [Lentisphaerota bacterium]
MPLRVAVIGCGPIGNRHADIYLADELADLVAVCDIRRDRAGAASARLSVPAFHDVPSMLAAIQPDVCSVATGGFEYGSDHHEPTIQALEANCHVLCEKPICNTIPEAEEMVACARKHDRCFGIDLNHRFTPAAMLAREWMDEGLIGHQLFINMAMWICNPNESSPYYMIKALNPHSVDIMRHFGGDIEAVQCFAMTAPGRSIWSTMALNVRFASGAVGHLTASYDMARGHPMERCEVAGLKGRFVLDDMWRNVTLYPAGDLVKRQYTNPVFGGYRDFHDTFSCRLHTFIEQVSNGVSPAEINGSGEQGLAAQKVLDAAIRSIETESIVQVDE